MSLANGTLVQNAAWCENNGSPEHSPPRLGTITIVDPGALMDGLIYVL